MIARGLESRRIVAARAAFNTVLLGDDGLANKVDLNRQRGGCEQKRPAPRNQWSVVVGQACSRRLPQ
jgi:hypothetical protein